MKKNLTGRITESVFAVTYSEPTNWGNETWIEALFYDKKSAQKYAKELMKEQKPEWEKTDDYRNLIVEEIKEGGNIIWDNWINDNGEVIYCKGGNEVRR